MTEQSSTADNDSGNEGQPPPTEQPTEQPTAQPTAPDPGVAIKGADQIPSIIRTESEPKREEG